MLRIIILKKHLFFVAFSILLLFVPILFISKPVNSNPAIIDPETWTDYLTGSILPQNISNTLRMDEATVNFNIQTGHTSNLKVDFEGIYHIYNNEETAYYVIANPFSSVFEGLTETIELKSNGIDASYVIYQPGFIEPSAWEEYLDPGLRFCVISNISFEENETTILEYSWSSTFKTTEDFAVVKYDVGTARAWSNTLNERIEFKVRGVQPDRVTSNFETDRLEIVKTTFYNLYIWNWELEFLNANEVGLIFKVNDLKRALAGYIFSYCIYILLPVNIVLFTQYIIKKRRLRGAKK